MPVHRGFVQRIQVGRAGLATVRLLHDDGSTGDYVIRDLDGDPERFNERLSKLAILRDAMNRAEPVEIEHTAGEQGQEIDRAVRITRDALDSNTRLETVEGLVIYLQLTSENRASAGGEVHDAATVMLLTTDLLPRTFVLDMQAPERAVAAEQFEMLADAHRNGTLAVIVAWQAPESGQQTRIVTVGTASLESPAGQGERAEIDAFVESLTVHQAGGVFGNLARVAITTAPPFTGAGNSIANDPFTPARLSLLVARGSLPYELCEAGLRDNVRMHFVVRVANPRQPNGGEAVGVVPPATKLTALILSAELLAPLSSASYPVWVKISRDTLDVGGEHPPSCTDGVPSSDLNTQTLRDLHIPYPAVWTGVGCFNHGVYRFQFEIAAPFTIEVDCRPLCLYESSDKEARFAYACLGGEHVVTVSLPKWTCEQEFKMEVYRIR